MAEERRELLRGTLDLLILRVLGAGPAHGYTIVSRIRERSAGALSVEEGSLYPALHRLERKGWLEARWGRSEAGRRAKFYRLSRAGRTRLVASEREWRQTAAAIERVLGAQPEAGT